MAKYVHNADHKSFTDLATLFTENGTFTPLDVNGETLVQMSGREEKVITGILLRSKILGI